MDSIDPLSAYPALMSPPQVAEYMGVSVNTLKLWRKERKGPRYVKFGEAQNAMVRYPRENLRAYVESYAVEPAGPTVSAVS